MKFMHIADLHLGKSIYGLSMMESHDQPYWVEQFITLCQKEKPDAVVIAGDVYDRSLPGSDAVELLDHMITSLSKMNITVMMIAGNHDSGQRLSFASSILAKENVYIAGTAKKEMEHITFANPDGYGPITFWLMPYIFPEEISVLFNDDSIHTYEDAVRRLLSAQAINFQERNVLVAHQNVTVNGKEVERGGSESMVGGVGEIDYSAFMEFDYVALGHIHSAYPVGKETIRYAGTPLCYHFSETRQPEKGPLLIEIKEKGTPVSITLKSIQPYHKMRAFKGTYEEIKELLDKDTGRKEYVSITIIDQRISPEMAAYFRDLFTVRKSVLMELISTFNEYGTVNAGIDRKEAEKPMEDLFSQLFAKRNGGTPPTDEEYHLMQYGSRLIQESNPHAPLEESEVKRLLNEALKSGGNGR